MKLINYIKAPNHPKDIIDLDYYESIDYKCEVHGINLEIEDGWDHRRWEFMYYTDYEFEKLNPHCVGVEQYLGEQQNKEDVPIKIIYCKTCMSNYFAKIEAQHEETLSNQKPKKIKGQKSKKYKKTQ